MDSDPARVSGPSGAHRATRASSRSGRADGIARGDPARFPRRGDLRSSVAVAGGPHRRGSVERHLAVGRPPPREVAAQQPAPVRLGVLASQPAHHPPPCEGVEVVEGQRGDPAAKVGAPAPEHRVEPVQQLGERLVVAGPRDLPDLRLDGRERPSGRVGVDVAAAVAPPALALDAPAEEVDALVDVDHAGLLRSQRQPERREHLLGLRDQPLGVAPLASDADDEVVGVADESVGRPAAAADRVALVPLLAHRLPRPGEVLVQRGERDVSHQRRENPALGGASELLIEAALLGQDAGLQERLDERHDALVHDSPPHPIENGRVRERVETRLDVCLHDPLVRAAREVVDLGDRVVGSASGPKAVGAAWSRARSSSGSSRRSPRSSASAGG
jgi:hypothetical protein